MHVGGVIATVVIVGLAVWAAVRKPYDKRIRRGERAVTFPPGSLGGARRRSS